MSMENPPIGITPENIINRSKQVMNIMIATAAAKITVYDLHIPQWFAQKLHPGGGFLHFIAEGASDVAIILAAPIISLEMYNHFFPGIIRTDSDTAEKIGRVGRAAMAGGATFAFEKLAKVPFNPHDRHSFLLALLPLAYASVVGAFFLPSEQKIE